MKTLEQIGVSPAPWKQGERTPFCGDNIVLCDYRSKDNLLSSRIVAYCNDIFSDDQARIDARLIAAAPELYEALAAMLSCSEREAPFTKGSGMSIAMDMARKAIEKAGGEA